MNKSNRASNTGAKRPPRQRVSLGSVVIGDKFVFHAAEILGSEYDNKRKPPFECLLLTVVGFQPRYVNNVVVQDELGRQSLMPLHMVERALSGNNGAGSRVQ